MINKSDKWSGKRRRSLEIPIGKSVLFVYCGECTEPNYFNAILDDIKTNMEVKSSGITKFNYDYEISAVDPSNMAKQTPKLVSNRKKQYCEVYVVFDKDSFTSPNFDNAIKSINNLTTDECEYVALWSNQCIELWFILNFEYLQSKLERIDYFDKIGKYLNIKYEKNVKDIATRIKESGGSWSKAIKYSEKLKDEFMYKPYSKQFPATNVDYVFKKYSDFIKKY